MKFWFGDEPRDQSSRKFLFGKTSLVFVIHHEGDWHWRLYCFDFIAKVKAVIGCDQMPVHLKTYLDPSASDYDSFSDVSPTLPTQVADECAARVVCFAKWFASSRTANGFHARFDETLYLRSVQSRMVAWRQGREKIMREEPVPKLTQSSICSLCPYDRCPTSAIGLPAGLTNSNSLCFLNQALVVLAASGPWSPNPNSLIGHLAVDVLVASVAGEPTVAARNSLARGLFDEGQDDLGFDDWGLSIPDYSGQQQCLSECLQRLFHHISGPFVTHAFRYTCTMCNKESQSQQSNPAIFIKGSQEFAVMNLEDLLTMDQTESTVHWQCLTPDCQGNVEQPNVLDQLISLEQPEYKFALGASFMAGALPNYIIVVCKRRQVEGRLMTDIQIPSVVPVKTCDTDTFESNTELYSPIYVALHSSGSDEDSESRSTRRSSYNVPDSVELSVAHANGGHYFGAALESRRDGHGSGIVYVDDDKLDVGQRGELSAQGKKVVVVVLRKQALEGVDMFKIAAAQDPVVNFDSTNLVEEWSTKHQNVSQICHRVANQVFLFLRTNDAARSCFTQEQFDSRREFVHQLFRDYEADQTRRVVLTAIAIMWEMRIVVYKLRDECEVYGTTDKARLSVFFHDGVLYPTSMSTSDSCKNVQLTSGVTLGLLKARRSSSAHRAAFDTIIPLIYPLVVSMFDVDPDHEHICSIRKVSSTVKTGALPQKRNSTYWFGRKIMESLCKKEDSLLARESSISTVVECSYAMIFHVVQVVERWAPFTHESNHLILGCGRRGALLLHLMVDKDMTVVGLDVSEVAISASKQHIAKLQATDSSFRPNIYVEVENVENLTSLDGFTSVSRFAGGKGAGTEDHASRNKTDELVLSSPTVKVYWNNHLPNMNDLDLSEGIKAEWRALVIPNTRQEDNHYSTFVYFRVKPADSAAKVCPYVMTLLTAAQQRTLHSLVEHPPRTPRHSERKAKSKAATNQGPPASGSPSTSKIGSTPKSPTNNRPATGSPSTPRKNSTPKSTVIPPVAPNTRGRGKSQAQKGTPPPIDGPLAVPFAVPDPMPGRKPHRGHTKAGDEADEDGTIDQESATTIFKDTARTLTTDFNKVLTEIKKNHQALNSRLTEADKKGLTKTELSALSKQLSSAGFKESAQILQQIPAIEAKLDAAQEAIKNFPNNLTTHMRALEKTLAGKTLAENTGAKVPHSETSEVVAQLSAILSQIPEKLSAALPPAGIQAGMDDVQKVLLDLKAGIATNQRDLLWLETKRVDGLKDQALALKAEAKRKKLAKDMDKKKRKAEKKEKKEKKKEKKEKKRQKIAAEEKEQMLAAKIKAEEEKTTLLSLLQKTGALRMQPSPSKAPKKARSSSQTPEKSKSRSRDRARRRSKSRSRDRARGRSKSRSRDRARGRSKSRSRDRARRRSKSRSRDRARSYSKSRSRDRATSKQRSRSRDRDRPRSGRSTSQSKHREAPASVLEAGEEAVGLWLIHNNLGNFRDIFKKNNVCGADLKSLSSQQLTEFGMAAHQETRFLKLIANL